MKIDKRSFEKQYCGCWNEKEEVLEPETLQACRDELNKFGVNDIMIDAGANTGLMSLYLKKGKSIAVESSDTIFKVLCSNINLNGLNIKPLNLALYNEVRGYSVAYSEWGGTSTIMLDDLKENKTLTGDQLVETYVEPQEKVRLIKIDCEENSRRVLESFTETIINHKPVVIVELKDGIKEDWFKEMGYENFKYMEGNLVVK